MPIKPVTKQRLGLAAGAETISGCRAFAKTLDKRQLQALGVYRHPRTRELMLPFYPSLCRILAGIDPQEAERALSAWQQQSVDCPLALAIDGKPCAAPWDTKSRKVLWS